jgi:hypothetical protein
MNMSSLLNDENTVPVSAASYTVPDLMAEEHKTLPKGVQIPFAPLGGLQLKDRSPTCLCI